MIISKVIMDTPDYDTKKKQEWLVTRMDHFRVTLTEDFKLKTPEVDNLLKGFQGWIEEFAVTSDKVAYVHFITEFLILVEQHKEHCQNYLKSLVELDINHSAMTYSLPVEDDRQAEVFVFQVLCEQTMQCLNGMEFGFRGGIQFVHRYSIGEVEGDFTINLAKHFDEVSAIRVVKTMEAYSSNVLWPLKLILSSGRWTKTIVLSAEDDFVDVGFGKDVPCQKYLAPLTLTVIPHVPNNLKYQVDVLGKLLNTDARSEHLKKLSLKLWNPREFGFQLNIF